MVITVPVAPERHLSVVPWNVQDHVPELLFLVGSPSFTACPRGKAVLWNKVPSLKLAQMSMGKFSESHKRDTIAFFFTPNKTEKK